MTGLTVADQRLHPGTMALRWLAEAPQTIIGLPVLAGIASDIGIGVVGLIMIALAIVTLGFAYLRWSRFRYGIGATEMVIESGVLSRNRRTIPFSRIQDVDVERKLLHRLFGLAKVKVESGGGGKDEGSLDSVSIAEADRIRAAVRRAKAQHSADIAEIDVADEQDDIIYALPLAKVLKFGLFSYSFSSLAAIAGGLWYLYTQLEDVLGGTDRLVKQAQGYAPARFESSWILGGIALLLLLALVTSVGKVLLRDYDFRLSRDARGLRRTRGLLTRTEVMIPKQRVQLGLITSGPIWARFGYEALALQTLGAAMACLAIRLQRPLPPAAM